MILKEETISEFYDSLISYHYRFIYVFDNEFVFTIYDPNIDDFTKKFVKCEHNFKNSYSFDKNIAIEYLNILLRKNKINNIRKKNT